MERPRSRARGAPSSSIYKDITAAKSAYSAIPLRATHGRRKAPLSGYGALALYPTAFRRLGLSIGNKAPSAAVRRSIYAREWSRDRDRAERLR